MSDDPRKKSRANGNRKGSNVFSLENSEPSSNPTVLSAFGRSLSNDKKVRTGPKAVLPGAVAHSTSTYYRQSISTENTLTEFVSGKEGTKGSNYRRRTVTSPKFISEQRVATGKKVSYSPDDNKVKNQINSSASTEPLRHSEPSTSSVSVKSSLLQNQMELRPRAVVATDKGFQEKNKYKAKVKARQGIPGAVALSSDISSRPPSNSKDSRTRSYGLRQIASTEIEDISSCNDSKAISPVTIPLKNSEPSALSALVKSSKPYITMDIGTKATLPGAVGQSTSASYDKLQSNQNTLTEVANGTKGTKGSNYRRRTDISPRLISEPRVATRKQVSSSLTDSSTEHEINASGPTKSLKNSQPRPLKSPLSHVIDGSYSSNTSNRQQPIEAHNGASSSQSDHIPVEMSHERDQYIYQDNSNADYTQELVVATLVESDRNIHGPNVIVDAIVVDDKPTTWFKDRRTLLIIGITVIVAVSITATVTVLLLGERNNETPDADIITPSSYDSLIPTTTSSLSPSLSPSTMQSAASTSLPSPRDT